MTRRELIFLALAKRRSGMVRLPGGVFAMGADKDALLQQFPKAGPGLRAMLLAETGVHRVTIPPFLIDECEVTNAQFRKFIRARPAWRKSKSRGNYLSNWNDDEFPAGQSDFPVVFVTWQAAVAYAEWAGKR